MTADPYTDELTPAEAKLGFILAYIANPKAIYMGHGSLAPAVILPLGPSNRIAKLTSPSGEVSYAHQVYGTYQGSADPEWSPVSVGLDDARLAISTAKRGVVDVRVNPVPSKISLMCPKCTRGFTVDADHLPIDGTTTCIGEECKYTAKTQEFNAPNF